MRMREKRGKMVINMTTTITTNGHHNGVIVHSGIQSPPYNGNNVFWPYGTNSAPLNSFRSHSIDRVAPLAIQDTPSTSHHQIKGNKVDSLSIDSSSTESSPLAPLQLNVFNVVEKQGISKFILKESDDEEEREMMQLEKRQREEISSTASVFEIIREPGERFPLKKTLLPSSGVISAQDPFYERWENFRRETMIDDREGPVTPKVQWKDNLVDRRSLSPEPSDSFPLESSFLEPEPYWPSPMSNRLQETREEARDEQIIKQSFSLQDLTYEKKTGGISPHSRSSPFSPSSYHTASALSPQQTLSPSRTPRDRVSRNRDAIGHGAFPNTAKPLVGDGAYPKSSENRPLSYRNFSSRGVSPFGYSTPQSPIRFGAYPSDAYYNNTQQSVNTPDEYHDRLRRQRSLSPLRTVNRATSPMYSPQYDAHYASKSSAHLPVGAYSPAVPLNPSMDGRVTPGFGQLDRSKSRSGDIFALYQTRDALDNIVGHFESREYAATFDDHHLQHTLAESEPSTFRSDLSAEKQAYYDGAPQKPAKSAAVKDTCGHSQALIATQFQLDDNSYSHRKVSKLSDSIESQAEHFCSQKDSKLSELGYLKMRLNNNKQLSETTLVDQASFKVQVSNEDRSARSSLYSKFMNQGFSDTNKKTSREWKEERPSQASANYRPRSCSEYSEKKMSLFGDLKLDKIIYHLNRFPLSSIRRSPSHPILPSSQFFPKENIYESVGMGAKVPVQRERPHGEESLRVSIDYDAKYAVVKKPAKPSGPLLTKNNRFVPSTINSRSKSPVKVVRIVKSKPVEEGKTTLSEKPLEIPLVPKRETGDQDSSRALPIAPPISSIPVRKPIPDKKLKTEGFVKRTDHSATAAAFALERIKHDYAVFAQQEDGKSTGGTSEANRGGVKMKPPPPLLSMSRREPDASLHQTASGEKKPNSSESEQRTVPPSLCRDTFISGLARKVAHPDGLQFKRIVVRPTLPEVPEEGSSSGVPIARASTPEGVGIPLSSVQESVEKPKLNSLSSLDVVVKASLTLAQVQLAEIPFVDDTKQNEFVEVLEDCLSREAKDSEEEAENESSVSGSDMPGLTAYASNDQKEFLIQVDEHKLIFSIPDD